jgi:hypothetical protein
VPGGGAEGLQLLVAVVQRLGGGQLQHGDLEGAEGVDDPVHVVAEDDQVGVVAGDRLRVRRERGQVRDRGVLGVVRGVVDGLDLRAGADGEQHLGRGGRQRDDGLGLFVQGELAVVTGDGDRPAAGIGAGGARGAAAAGVGRSAAGGQYQQNGEEKGAQRGQAQLRGRRPCRPGDGVEHGGLRGGGGEIAHERTQRSMRDPCREGR